VAQTDSNVFRPSSAAECPVCFFLAGDFVFCALAGNTNAQAAKNTEAVPTQRKWREESRMKPALLQVVMRERTSVIWFVAAESDFAALPIKFE